MKQSILGCATLALGLLFAHPSDGAPASKKHTQKITTHAKDKKPTPSAKSAKGKKDKKDKKVDNHKVLRKWKNILSQELQRHWKVLQKRKPPRVYYMAYVLQQRQRATVSARDGAVYSSYKLIKKPSYALKVRVRVGSHKLDSTGRDGYDWKIFRHLLPGPGSLPKQLTPAILQKHLWQTTDRGVKEAMGRYHRKRYVRSLKVEIKDKSGDFSKNKALQLEQMPTPLTFDMKRWKKALRTVSSFSLTDRRIVSSGIAVSANQENIIFVDSDGARIIKHKTLYMYTISLTYLSPKKEYLRNTRLSYVDTEDKLPNTKQLKQLLQKTLQEVVDEGNAPKGEPTEAPAILLPDVAGVLFHEALGHRLEAQRMLRESDGRTFRRKIGLKVIPRFLSVFDNPTLPAWRGEPLNGYYAVDDQGVKAQRVELIRDGVLKGFLMSRKPIDKFLLSNGHGRARFGRDPFSRMGSIIVQSKREFEAKRLRKMLLAEARRQGKPYAFIVARASGGYTHTGTYGIQSFKNHPKVVFQIDVKTGKQKLVKGLEMIGTPLTVVNNILATGKDYGVFNGFCGAESGYVPVSVVAPSLLLKTVEMQRVKINQKKDYLLPPPFDKTTKKTAAKAAPKSKSADKAAKAKTPAKAKAADKAAAKPTPKATKPAPTQKTK